MLDLKAIELLAKLVSFDTTSSKSNRACIDFIRDYLAEHGVASEIMTNDDGTKANLWATIGGGSGDGVVLAGHTDVVPVEGQKWTTDPFTLTERDDGKLYGRGSCDMKAFIACAMAMVPELVKGKLNFPVHFAFTHDEETDMSGAQRLCAMLRERNIKPRWAWIGEPTELALIDSNKGVAAFETTITGVPVHSGKPDMGLNAIRMAAKFIDILGDVQDERRANPFVPSRYDPPYTTINEALIKGGTAENIVPEHCKITWQTRVHPGDDHDAMLSDIDLRARSAFASRFAAFAPHAGMKTCTCFNIPPFLSSKDNRAVAALAAHTGATETLAVSFATEAGFLQELDIDVVVAGPGSIDQAHQPNEYVEKEQLSLCVDLMRRVLLSSPNL